MHIRKHNSLSRPPKHKKIRSYGIPDGPNDNSTAKERRELAAARRKEAEALAALKAWARNDCNSDPARIFLQAGLWVCAEAELKRVTRRIAATQGRRRRS